MSARSPRLRRCALLLTLTATALVRTASAQQGAVRSGDVVIRYWPGQARLATALLPSATALTFPGLPADILQRGDDVTVYLAPDAARFDSLTGGRAPDWGAGVALPQQGIIVVPGFVSKRTGTHQLPVILRHELAHVALQRHLGDTDIPRWFTEGYATWSAGQLDQDAGWLLRLAFATDRAPPLDSLTLDWPLLETDARTAYLLSASAARYLYSLGKPATFQRFLDEWAATGSLETSLRNVYVLSSPQFERLWRAHVKRRYGWLQVLAQSLFLWLGASLIVIVLFVVRRRRDRRRMEQLRATEPPDEPAYWLETADETPPPDETNPDPRSADAEDGPTPPRA